MSTMGDWGASIGRYLTGGIYTQDRCISDLFVQVLQQRPDWAMTVTGRREIARVWQTQILPSFRCQGCPSTSGECPITINGGLVRLQV